MLNEQIKKLNLDIENFSQDFVQIHQGISYVKVLMKHFVKIYPSFRQSDFIKFKDEPNIVARAMMLNPDSDPEIFFVCIRLVEDGKEVLKTYFRQKYFNEITEYIMKNKEQDF